MAMIDGVRWSRSLVEVQLALIPSKPLSHGQRSDSDHRGNAILNVVPWPTSEVQVIVPLCFSVMI